MVRSLTQWTKTLSFPSRISPNNGKKKKSTENVAAISTSVTQRAINNNDSAEFNNKLIISQSNNYGSEVSQVCDERNNNVKNKKKNEFSKNINSLSTSSIDFVAVTADNMSQAQHKDEEDDIYQSEEDSVVDSEKAIMSSVVYCIHHKEGCKWSDELRKLKGHLNTCKHDAIPCTSKCGAQIPRVLMEDHLKYTCPQRKARCDFCTKEFTGHSLETHIGSCGFEPIYCENKCGLKVPRRHSSQHKVNECVKRLLACRYCTKEFVADTLTSHHAKCGRVPVVCPNRCGVGVDPSSSAATNLNSSSAIINGSNGLLAREDLETHLKEHCTVSTQFCAFRDAGCRFKGARYSVEKHLEENCQEHLSMMCNIVTKQQHQIASLKSALSRLSLNYSGTLIWKISDFAAKIGEARSKDGMELVSPPFYTSQYGYKLQASLFPNGNGAGEDSHISVYIKILPGEYDALLRWPFAHSVSFTIFDQSTCPEKACNIVESFIPDPTWKNFQRPSKEPDSLGFGFPRFVSHDMLKKRHFMKDDTLFIRVKVDPSKIIAV